MIEKLSLFFRERTNNQRWFLLITAKRRTEYFPISASGQFSDIIPYIDLTPEVVVDGMGDSLKERFGFCHELKYIRNE